MTSFPGSPRVLKGALVAIDPINPVAKVVVFQYNPDTMTRRIDARVVSQEGERGEAMRLTGAPKETITLNIEIDAADQLDQGSALAESVGIYPTLAALEVMLYPRVASVIANDQLSAVGTIEIIPVDAPMILFVWGPERVLPVRLNGFSITEEAYDTRLNPLRAKIDLSLLVLSYQDLPQLSPARALFLAHHISKEILATSNIFNNASSTGVNPRL